MGPLTGKRILLVIGGGIAAYKVLDLIRRLRERGAHVRAAMTKAAAEFVTPLSVASLTGDKVYDDLFSLTDEAEMGHIELSRDADLLVVAPATADLLAKLANGLANDLASTLLLATDMKVLAAPAMNLRMWLHPATQRNVAILRKDGVLFVGPENGDMACGEYGPGRMAEPLEIVAAITSALESDTAIPLPPGIGARASGTNGTLAGKRVVVTSGPTHEPIDPVRYIANRSSGKQGHAIARAAAQAGADVALISGPVALPDPPGVQTIHVQTAREMLSAVDAALPADIFVATAAVADWRMAETGDSKLKKSGNGAPKLNLVENPDILAAIARRNQARPKLVVGFAAETNDVLAHARKKLDAKGCDMIVANDVSPSTGIMGGDKNAIHIVTREGIDSWPTLDKDEVARRLIARLAKELTA
ncbi:MAG TPA: bifunctional phosphopantothenoylcysteine decarboxylase/phosphopantothenate--cysteine ligase CoaBC [Beijerinckiaceae bacterium]|jgi:phosphopantothenoylcysteine decarboxylase/phosphopantothenate--cysteine ligase|nr:bifunctional phosphopantothenoylcysteine decarboxylase/phosphopantothenate--cysteine ligase CoaBC [Beijerinckiaceae bacterium]